MQNEIIIEAYTRIVRIHACSVDDIAIRLTLREQFLAEVRALSIAPNIDDEAALRQLLRLRKQKKLTPSRKISSPLGR
ncbi:hypothetical protein [Tuwongella immobilis]|uniref:Uncharacterized protein n=1 Tax=Tuwongella immobilis TaxID=692036 RepID=A0A6C2YRX4_9BACT|nr:hypothetical protein [Tuwongella immobilis]VIP04420.1 unnamed protein product [Tuwongella immobilis]VTS06202.1 unnamed protein product [Tuwongella immobilis]